MNVINGESLLALAPITDMLTEKHRDGQGVSYGLAEVGYDIRLKQGVSFKPPLHHAMTGLQVRAPMVHIEGFAPEFGNFGLASAIEEFNMPPCLVGIVHDKSTWARCGLSVLNTVIEPGWRGSLTLELVFHGQKELVIPAGSGIAQIIFHKIAHEHSYDGPYQDQEDRPVPSLINQN